MKYKRIRRCRICGKKTRHQVCSTKCGKEAARELYSLSSRNIEKD